MNTTPTALLGHMGCAVLAGGVAVLLGAFACIEPLPGPPGPKGEERRDFVRRLGALAFVDGIIRRLAVPLGPLLTVRARAALDARLERAGDFLGLRADEWVAWCLLVTMLCGCAGGALSSAMEWSGAGILTSMVLGAVVCVARVDAIERERQRLADRELPPAIDLVALSMGAGMDFHGAVRLVVESDARSFVAKELGRVLRDLSLGCTRREALLALGRRVPSVSVSDFVAAAVQAEQKGSPLSEVLANQATVSRLRRSVATEEAAARAGVLMVVPLMLLMGCIVLLLVGPLMVTGAAR